MREQLALLDAGPALRPHPATYPVAVLDAFRRLVPHGVVLDPFGGTGKIGRIGPQWTAISSELEPEWAIQGYRNHCALCVVADARSLPFAAGSIPAIATSPAYGNRMADHDASQLRAGGDGEKLRSDEVRSTYTAKLGRALTDGNAGTMHWGRAYRALHRAVWAECWRVLRPGGAIIANCKDFYETTTSGRALVEVCAWHWGALERRGFVRTATLRLPLDGDRNTIRMRAKGLATVDYEEVTAWRKP